MTCRRSNRVASTDGNTVDDGYFKKAVARLKSNEAADDDADLVAEFCTTSQTP